MTDTTATERTIIELKDGRWAELEISYRAVRQLLARAFQDESPFIEITARWMSKHFHETQVWNREPARSTVAIDTIALILPESDWSRDVHERERTRKPWTGALAAQRAEGADDDTSF